MFGEKKFKFGFSNPLWRQKQGDHAGEAMLCYYAELLYGNSMLIGSVWMTLFATMHIHSYTGD